MQSCLNLKNEFAVLKQLDHPNIIKTFIMYKNLSFIQQNDQTCCAIIIEKAKEDLYCFLDKELPCLTKIRSFYREIAMAVAYLHNNNLVHNDIKMENIFLFSNSGNNLITAKLADFGFARRFMDYKSIQEQRRFWEHRNKDHAAPEIFDTNRKAIFVEKKTDVFAFGASLYDALFRALPYSET
jgi:serine/threonine protein kinase